MPHALPTKRWLVVDPLDFGHTIKGADIREIADGYTIVCLSALTDFRRGDADLC